MATSWVSSSLRMAAGMRDPGGSLMHLTDRGSQFASHDYQRIPRARKIMVSVLRKACCQDQTCVESLIAL